MKTTSDKLPVGWIDFKDGFSPKGVFKKSPAGTHWNCMDFAAADSIESRLQCFFDFARERHAVYLRRSAGVRKPWTNDHHLQEYKFTNVYRELDTVSKWVMEEVIKPHEQDPNLWFMLCACRVINWPDSLAEMMDARGGFGIKGQYDPDVAFKVLMSRRARKLKTITGAYIVNSVTTKNDPDLLRGNKLAYIAHRTLGEIWQKRKEVESHFKSTLQDSIETLKKFRGYGPFISYQVTVDLSYSNAWLGRAKDLNTFNSAGPGTTRGLSRVFFGEVKANIDTEEKTKLLAFLLKASRNPTFWPNTAKTASKGFAPLSMPNISNVNCEFDKICRLQLGQGRPRSRYPGTYPVGTNQLTLF